MLCIFLWCCANNAQNLRLLISVIYDVRKGISEYHKYFESLQLNIQLEKGYLVQQKLLRLVII